MRARLVSVFLLGGLVACSHSPKVQSEAYAKLRNHKTFEYDMSTVWKGVKSAVHDHVIKSEDGTDPKSRSLQTDWVEDESRDKYQTYMVDGSPRRKNLKARFKYQIVAKSVVGGIEVTVNPTEEVEKLKEDGSSDGFSRVSDGEIDPSRPSEMLEKIDLAILGG